MENNTSTQNNQNLEDIIEVVEKDLSAQQYLDEKYPLENRDKVVELDISNKNLEEKLILNGFTNLKKLDCSHNKITSLDIVDSNNSLEELIANDNQLSQLTWDFDIPTNLKVLNLANNKWHNNRGYWGFSDSFPKLQFLDVRNSGIRLSSMGDISYVKKIHRETDANKWLNEWYPKKEEKEGIKNLDIRGEKLEGSLDLSNFINLETLDCSNNKLTKIILTNNKKLASLYCRDNKLTDLVLTDCENLEILKADNSTNDLEHFNELSDISFLSQLPNPEKLKVLYLAVNKIDSDLTPFARFTSLEDLDLGMSGYSKEITEERGNKLSGSLETLKNLTKLKRLFISNTDIDGDIKDLPNSIEEIYCSSEEIPESKVENIAEQLKEDSRFILEGNRYVRKQTIQESLDKRYLNKEEVKEIDLSELVFTEEGELKIENFPNLKEIKKENWLYIYEVIKVTIKDCPKLEKANITWFKDNRELNVIDCPKLTKLDCYYNQLEELSIKNCPKLEEIDFSYNKLEEVNLKELPNLKKLDCSDNKLADLGLSSEKLKYLEEINISNNDDLSELDRKLKKDNSFIFHNNKYVKKQDAQKWLNENFPEDGVSKFPGYEDLERSKIKELNISERGLVGELDLSGFTSLEELDCSSNELKKLDIDSCLELRIINCLENQLTNLDLSNFSQLEEITCRDNLLTDIRYPSNFQKLTSLSIRNNNLSEQDISIFKNFTNLKDYLWIGNNDKEKIKKGIYNRFYGSLKSLEKLTKLESIHISNTDVNEVDIKSLSENLPNLKEIQCSVEERPTSKLKEIKEELDLYQKKIDKSNTKKRLNEMYPDKSTKVLDYLYSESLRGSLDLSEYKDLEVLDCHDNELTSIDISKNNKLKKLNISDTDISFGLEQFPDSLEEIICSFEGERKVKELAKQLESYAVSKKEGKYNFKAWKESNDSSAQKRLDKDYPKENRRKETNLDISKKKLAWKLKLEGFTSLESLNCSENKLTSLDLNDCPKLTKINCSNNSFTDLGFLRLGNKSVGKERKEGFDYKKLKKLAISNNKFSSQSLEQLKNFTELTELDISGCNFEGSLEPLGSLTKLEEINISNTNIERGLEYLPDSCKKLYCNRKLKCRSAKLVKELGKYLKGDDKGEYYNLAKWREERRNGVALIIPLERLFVIKGNISKFHDKWGEKGEDGLSRLSNLQTPEQFSKYWYAVIPQWTSRAGAVAGGILALNDNYNQVGGAIGIVSTATETVTSLIKENLYENKKKEWEDFSKDVDILWSSLDELVGLLKPLQITKLEDGKVNRKLKELNDDIYHFFSMYDIDGDGEIDHTELKVARSELTENLRKFWENKVEYQNEDVESAKKQIEDFLKKNDFKLDHNLDKRIKKMKKIEELKNFAECFQNKKEKLERIVEKMINLQAEIIEYRSEFYHWTTKKTQEVKEELKEEAEDIAEKKDISEVMSNQIESSALSNNWLKKPIFATIFGEKDKKEVVSANLEPVKDKELNNEETGKQEVSINVHQDPQEQSSTQAQIEQPPK